MVNVYIPTPFRGYVGNRTSVEVEGQRCRRASSTRSTASSLASEPLSSARTAPSRATSTSTSTTQEISALDGAQTKVNDGDQVAVIPALAGGAPDDEPAPSQ